MKLYEYETSNIRYATANNFNRHYILKQALRKFSETAKGWYWNMGKLYKKYAVKLEIMLSELKMSGK